MTERGGEIQKRFQAQGPAAGESRAGGGDYTIGVFDEREDPAPQIEHADDDDEEERSDTRGCIASFRKIYRKVCGSLTLLIMLCVLGVCVAIRCSSESAHPNSAGRSWSAGLTILGIAFGIALIVFFCRFVWIRLILKPFFAERRTLNLITWFLDPEFGVLIWTVTVLVLYTWAVDRSRQYIPFNDDFTPASTDIPFFNIGFISEQDHKVYRKTIFFLILWAARDVLIKAIMLKLMLGFLMNFNTEVVHFLHRYSQIRRLNAAWLKLVPTSAFRSESLPVANDVYEEVDNSASMVLVPVPTPEEAVSVAGEDFSKRQREYSKQRLRVIASMTTRSHSKQQLPAMIPRDSSASDALNKQGSFLLTTARGSKPDLLVPSAAPNSGEHEGSKWTTTARKKRQERNREREYHVNYTGRALPRQLEVKSILDTQKSRLSNLIAINWLREQPVMLFVDGLRCELRSQALAKSYGHTLFKTLLEFRQTLTEMEEEERALINQTECTPQLASAQAIANFKRRLSSANCVDVDDSVDGWLQGPEASLSAHGPRRSADSLKEQNLSCSDEDGGSSGNLATSQHLSAAAPDRSAPCSNITEEEEDVDDDNTVSDMQLVERTVTQAQLFQRGVDNFREVDVRNSEERIFQNLNARHGAEPPAASPFLFWNRKRGDTQNSERTEQSFAEDTMSSRRMPQLETTAHPRSTVTSRASTPLKSRHTRPPITDAQLAAITADEIRKVKVHLPDDRECLTEDFFELFMSHSEAKQLCSFLDPGKLGKITADMFTKGIVQTYKIRKQIVHSLAAQEEIESVFTRVCQYLVTFLSILAYLLVLGIDPNTIIVTGVSVLTAACLVLSFVYTDFVQSIILLVFINPYRIGDRLVVDGEIQYVKRITTYFTEFESLQGKPQYISHKELVAKTIINESRSKNASSEMRIFFSETTTPAQYAAFKKVIGAYVNSRPQEFVPGSLYVYIAGVAPSHYIQLSIWVNYTEGWGNWMFIRTHESALFQYIMRQAKVLGMYYRLPIQRWEEMAGDRCIPHIQPLEQVPLVG